VHWTAWVFWTFWVHCTASAFCTPWVDGHCDASQLGHVVPSAQVQLQAVHSVMSQFGHSLPSLQMQPLQTQVPPLQV
jgi:hypothetical protein